MIPAGPLLRPLGLKGQALSRPLWPLVQAIGLRPTDFPGLSLYRPPMLHIAIRRLLAVAVQDLIFTREEFNHLKDCRECFHEWEVFVRAAETQEDNLNRVFDEGLPQ